MAKKDAPKRAKTQRISLTIAIPVGIIAGQAAGPVLEAVLAEEGMTGISDAINTGMSNAVGAVPQAMTAAIMLGIAKMIVGGGSIPIGKYRIGL